ncbi:MAG: TSUP family transporter, partial [Planctomycetota bacterium]
MMEIAILIILGVAMGIIGGMLGIGGAVFMIPALTLIFDENQHLYQAAAMICIFFVSGAAMIAHRKAKSV